MNIKDFYMKHKGETCLIVSLGPNLKLTPPELFDYPSFSINSIFKYDGWKPDYYVGVDERLWVENTDEIKEHFADIPVFIPSPDYDYIDAPNFVRFKHVPRGSLFVGGWLPNHPDYLTKHGITYWRVLGAVFQIAYYMGFSRMLVIGIEHKPDGMLEHFWGHDAGAVGDQPQAHWMDEYKHWSGIGLAEVLNISEETYVPEDVIPRGNYKDWINA